MSSNSTIARIQAATNADLADPALCKLRDLVYRTSGIFHAENKFYLLALRSRRRMREIGSNSFADYLDQLTTRATCDVEMRNLLNEITIGETCFFRSRSTIDALSKIIFPTIVALPGKQALTKVRVWSAGCSTGEESYTLSILFLEHIAPKFKDWKIEIVATDLNDDSLAKCREGLYGEYSMRNLSAPMREKYFRQDAVRAPVKFDRLNLQDQPKMLFMKGFDLVFCANVLIYFDIAAKQRTVEHFYNGLVPGGHFFLGECETLFGIDDQFHLVHFPGATGYYKPVPGEYAGGQK
jgi:chemotaxis protein methyltransferase CheR